METLKLWQERDTLKAMKDKRAIGAVVSLRKWDSLLDNLNAVLREAFESCGLCIKIRKQEGLSCGDCPFTDFSKQCIDDSSLVQKFGSDLRLAISHVYEIRNALISIRDRPSFYPHGKGGS